MILEEAVEVSEYGVEPFRWTRTGDIEVVLHAVSTVQIRDKEQDKYQDRDEQQDLEKLALLALVPYGHPAFALRGAHDLMVYCCFRAAKLANGDKKARHKGRHFRAENGTRTRDPDLGKVVLYQLSYFRSKLEKGCKDNDFRQDAPACHTKFILSGGTNTRFRYTFKCKLVVESCKRPNIKTITSSYEKCTISPDCRCFTCRNV